MDDGLGVRRGFGVQAGKIQQWQIVDRAGPGQFSVIERRVVMNGRESAGKGHEYDGQVQNQRDKQRDARDAAFNPKILEDTGVDIVPDIRGTGKDRA